MPQHIDLFILQNPNPKHFDTSNAWYKSLSMTQVLLLNNSTWIKVVNI